MMSLLKWFEEWYKSNCDGDWEHNCGIHIGTLDNPGWRIEINLVNTELEDKVFDSLKIERTNDNWVHCRVENSIFKGAGGTENLEELLKIFKTWTVN